MIAANGVTARFLDQRRPPLAAPRGAHAGALAAHRRARRRARRASCPPEPDAARARRVPGTAPAGRPGRLPRPLARRGEAARAAASTRSSRPGGDAAGALRARGRGLHALHGAQPPLSRPHHPAAGEGGARRPAAAVLERRARRARRATAPTQEDAADKVERQVRKSAAALLLEHRIGDASTPSSPAPPTRAPGCAPRSPPVEGRLERGSRGSTSATACACGCSSTDVERGFIDFVRENSWLKPAAERPFVPAGFFSFRTPLLPFEELEAFGEGLEAPGAAGDPERLEAALAADRARLRARLAALAERPEVLEAVFLASPSLYEGLGRLAGAAGQQEGAARRARPGALPLPHDGAGDAVRPLLRLLGGDGRAGAGAATRIAVGPRAGLRAAHPARHGLPLRALRGPGARSGGARGAHSTAPTPASTAPPAACATPRRGSTARCAPTTWWRWIRTTTWRRRCAAPRGAPRPRDRRGAGRLRSRRRRHPGGGRRVRHRADRQPDPGLRPLDRRSPAPRRSTT